MLTTPLQFRRGPEDGRRLAQQSHPEASAYMQLAAITRDPRPLSGLHAAADAASVGERPSSSQSAGTLCNYIDCGRVPSFASNTGRWIGRGPRAAPQKSQSRSGEFQMMWPYR